MTSINHLALMREMQAAAGRAHGVNPEFLDNAVEFGVAFEQAMNQVNGTMQQSEQLKTRYEQGDNSVSLADTMVAGAKSTLAFEATLRVRNQLVQAYKDIMNMPV